MNLDNSNSSNSKYLQNKFGIHWIQVREDTIIFNLISYHSYSLQCCMLPEKRYLSQGMCLYQVMMTLLFLNDIANDAESTQNSKITS